MSSLGRVMLVAVSDGPTPRRLKPGKTLAIHRKRADSLPAISLSEFLSFASIRVWLAMTGHPAKTEEVNSRKTYKLEVPL